MNKPMVAGNWKMHCTLSETRALIQSLRSNLKEASPVDIVLAPPYTALHEASQLLEGSIIKLSAQNMHFESSGAFTGEVSGAMLKDIGCEYVILGHSERRHIFKEDDLTLRKKISAACSLNLKTIFCIGETEEQREAGLTQSVLSNQIEKVFEDDNFCLGPEYLIIAYEPVWAIGTGKNATPEQAQEAHEFIRKKLNEIIGVSDSIRILYGGSVKPNNSADLMAQPDIDGLLVGGASLVAESFYDIIKSAF